MPDTSGGQEESECQREEHNEVLGGQVMRSGFRLALLEDVTDRLREESFVCERGSQAGGEKSRWKRVRCVWRGTRTRSLRREAVVLRESERLQVWATQHWLPDSSFDKERRSMARSSYRMGGSNGSPAMCLWLHFI